MGLRKQTVADGPGALSYRVHCHIVHPVCPSATGRHHLRYEGLEMLAITHNYR